MSKSKKEGFLIKYYWDGSKTKDGKPKISVSFEQDGKSVKSGRFSKKVV